MEKEVYEIKLYSVSSELTPGILKKIIVVFSVNLVVNCNEILYICFKHILYFQIDGLDVKKSDLENYIKLMDIVESAKSYASAN